MKDTPILSVVIPTCDRNAELSECLQRLAPGAQTLTRERYEVIVTDDGRQSTAESLVLSQFPWARWIKGPRCGIGANRNNGASLASGDWLVFIDSDTLPDPHCLSAFRAAILANHDAIAFEGAIHPLGDLSEQWIQCPVNMKGGLFWTANVAVCREVFVELGGFDGNYRGYNEDQDLYLRLLDRKPVKFLPEAIVSHPVRKTSLTRTLRAMPTQLRDWSYHLKKHGKRLGQSNVLTIALRAFEFHGRATARSLRCGHFGKALVEMLWVFNSFLGLPYCYLRQQAKPATIANPLQN